MLKKVLKYDFLPVYQYWWIAAVSIILLSILSGFGLSALISDKNYPALVEIISGIGIFFVILGYGAFSLFSAILVFGRFYKNFFTDEGYLTFTLPVKRSVLLNSKLILYVTTAIATSLVIVFSLLLFLLIGSSDIPLSINSIIESLCYLPEEIKPYLLIYIPELIVFSLLSTILSCLCIFCCITIACIIVKKHQILAAIGIYYGANIAYSMIFRSIGQLIADPFYYHVSYMTQKEIYGFLALIGLGIIFFTLLFCILLYALECWLLNDKLNLE